MKFLGIICTALLLSACANMSQDRSNRFPASQDSDRDGVPNERDYCPSVPGPAKNEGCPTPDASADDQDEDGISNKDDACPQSPGPEENRGCPTVESSDVEDQDEDGVPNKYDACPETSGPAANRGCPYP